MKTVRFQHYWLVVIASALLVLTHAIIKVMLYERFDIRGLSMYPALKDGEKVYVDKTAKRAINRGDIVIFNNPDPYMKARIELKINVVYAKRCVACPGDTIRIRNGYYLVNGVKTGSLVQQRRLSEMTDSVLKAKDVYMPAYPYLPGWTIKDMGPVYIPCKGDTVRIDSVSARVYSRAIEYETGIPQDSIVASLKTYRFKHDYYFFGGDNVEDSRDSRYFGIVPDDFVIGVVNLRDKRPAAVRDVLAFSGENRSELEYVLDYYSCDREKRGAAEYLIAGMKDKYGLGPGGEKVYDARIITADFLINNIEDAIFQYHSKPWNRELPFEDFCELLLPYRIHNEPISYWKDAFRKEFGPVLDTLHDKTDVIAVANAVGRLIDIRRWVLDYSNPNQNVLPDSLNAVRRGDCQAMCDFYLFVFRSLGIPSATDRYKVGNIHSWNVIRDTSGRYEIFVGGYFAGNGIMRGGVDGRTKGKVVRDIWQEPGWKDVTADYFGHNHILSSSPVMGLFARKGITPLTLGKRGITGYRYDDLEPGKIYFPMKDGECDGYPFLLSNDGFRKKELVPSGTTDLVVSRKVKMYGRLYERLNSNLGAVVEASDYPDFRVSDTLGILPRARINYNYLQLHPLCPRRYFRLSASGGNGLKMAEIRMFRDVERKDTVKLSLLGSSKCSLGKAEAVLDGDELSHFETDASFAYVTLDASCPEMPSLMEWVPLNDDNFIRYGDEYELMYHAGKRGWLSAGRLGASDTLLTFTGVPSDALYLLKDLTRGVEEEVFIMKDGKQLFL